MNLKLKRFGITMLSFLLLLINIVSAYALEGRASPVFESGYVITDSSLYTEFGAATKKMSKICTFLPSLSKKWMGMETFFHPKLWLLPLKKFMTTVILLYGRLIALHLEKSIA